MEQAMTDANERVSDEELGRLRELVRHYHGSTGIHYSETTEMLQSLPRLLDEIERLKKVEAAAIAFRVAWLKRDGPNKEDQDAFHAAMTLSPPAEKREEKHGDA